MTIEHHPPTTLVTAYAAGTLDQGRHVAVATHLTACRQCRALMREAEMMGGDILTKLPPAELSSESLAKVLQRLDAPAPPKREMAETASEIPGLPAFVRRFHIGDWQPVAPSLSVRRIELPEPGPTRVFLLKSRPGARFVRHTHTAFEMTCVLAGGFEHDGAHYEPGDFDLGDDKTEHLIKIAPGKDCISLVAMQGQLRLHGILGRLLQPFVRL